MKFVDNQEAFVAPDEKLYLAISAATFEVQFARPAFAVIVEDKRLPLLVVHIEREEIVRWVN